MNEFALIAVSAILSSNVVAMSGVGAISLQAEKRNFLYMLANTLCVVLSALVSGALYFVVHNYVLVAASSTELMLSVIVIFAVLTSFVSSAILKATSKEIYFLYESSYGLPIQTLVVVGILLLGDFTRSFGMSMYELLMMCVGYIIVQFVFYPIYDKLDNHHTLKPARNIPLMLYCLSIMAMIFYMVATIF